MVKRDVNGSPRGADVDPKTPIPIATSATPLAEAARRLFNHQMAHPDLSCAQRTTPRPASVSATAASRKASRMATRSSAWNGTPSARATACGTA